MSETHWTPRLVEAYLAEAADTLRRLPEPRSQRYRNNWPEIVRGSVQINCSVVGLTHPNPSPLAIDQMEATVLWLRWLAPAAQKIVWDRANGHPWKAIAFNYGIDRTTAWRHWSSALVMIAARLNGASDATTMQHDPRHYSEPDSLE